MTEQRMEGSISCCPPVKVVEGGVSRHEPPGEPEDQVDLIEWRDAFLLRARAGDLGLALGFAIPWMVHPISTLFPFSGAATVGISRDTEPSTPLAEPIKVMESSEESFRGVGERPKLKDSRESEPEAQKIQVNVENLKDARRFAHGADAYKFYRKLIATEIQVNHAASGGKAYNNPYAILKVAWKSGRKGTLAVEKEKPYAFQRVLPKHRPWFTMIVCSLQIIGLINVLIWGGVIRGGTLPSKVEKFPVITFRGRDRMTKWNSANVWLGPNLTYFISIGAIYGPCIRRDNVLYKMITDKTHYKLTEPLGCCLHRTRNVSATTTLRECEFLSNGVASWRDGGPCSESELKKHHLRPCCFGSLGSCLLLRNEDCHFLGGKWYAEKDHCFQANCLENVCGHHGMGSKRDNPFLPSYPLQIWRFLVAPFIHAGFIHVFFVVFHEWLVGRSIENMVGSARVAFVFFISAIGGYGFGIIFNPYVPQVGGTVPLCGLFGTSLLEILQSWPYAYHRLFNLIFVLISLTMIFLAGTFTLLDNFSHLGGLLLGMLSGLLVMNHLNFNSWNKNTRNSIAIFSFCLLSTALLAIFGLVYFLEDTGWCKTCYDFSCIHYNHRSCNLFLDLRVTDFMP